MEKEERGQLPFLYVLVMKRRDRRLDYRVLRKPTHIDRCLQRDADRDPEQKRKVVKTLNDQALRICEPHFLRNDLDTALQANGYSVTEI